MGRKSQKSEKSASIKATTIPSKILGTKQRKRITLERSIKVDVYFCLRFDDSANV